jgi:DNA-binding response OmpR family regulator
MVTPDKEKPIVLLVEDNAELLDLLMRSLQRRNEFLVYGATDGISGLHSFFEICPHCVVVDIKMPGLDGYQFARAIRGDPSTAETPIIFLTAMTREDDRFYGLAAGGDLYLTKPTTPQSLTDAIHQVIVTTPEDRVQRIQSLASTFLSYQ